MYRTYMLTVDLQNVVFYDETSFSERGEFHCLESVTFHAYNFVVLVELHRKRARAPRGENAYAHKITYGPAADNRSFNCGVMTSLKCAKGFVILNAEHNAQTSENFIEAMVNAVELGVVTQGTVVVLDNAPTHMSVESLIFVYRLFETVGARLVLLPTYSPELNPCELLFGMIKNRLYRGRRTGSLLEEVGKACQRITWDNVFEMYHKCIFGALDEF
jgi:transposase